MQVHQCGSQTTGRRHPAKSQNWVGACDQCQMRLLREVFDEEIDLFVAFGRADDFEVIDEDQMGPVISTRL
jgi:hypothetical protein